MNKILILNRRYCLGEAWTNRVLAYAKGLSELGCEVSLVYLITDSKRTPYHINIPNVRVINLWEKDNFLESKFRVLSYFRNLKRLKNLINKGDKVFIYGAENRLLTPAISAGAEVYAEITEHPYIYNTKGLKGEEQIDKQSRKLNVLKGLCVISYKLKSYFTNIGFAEDKIRISNMFVDSTRFDIPKTQNVEPYIAYCGVISYGKDGVDVLIKSFAIFHQYYPEYRLKLIGRAISADVLQQIKSLCAQEGVEEYVDFAGQVQPSQMPQLLVDAKILALARPNNLQAQSGFPTKLGEYLSTGNPVLVTSVGEIPLFIRDGYNGFLSEPDNPACFANKLKWIADHYEEACVVAKRGRILAENEFSYTTQSKVLYDLIFKQ